MARPTASLMTAIRSHCLALPEVNERLSHGAPTFFIRDKRSFVTVWLDGHHHVDFAHLWCACDTELRALLIEERPRQFFLPAYVAHRGWIAVRLDSTLDVSELMDLLDLAYRLIAPASLVRQLP